MARVPLNEPSQQWLGQPNGTRNQTPNPVDLSETAPYRCLEVSRGRVSRLSSASNNLPRDSRVPPTICLEALECVPPTICLETLECLSRLSSASNNLPRDSRVRPLFLSFARMFVESQCDECLRGLEAGSRGSRGSRDPPTIASHMAKLNVYPYQNFEMYAMSAW